jgi:signal transduction histidine kinase
MNLRSSSFRSADLPHRLECFYRFDTSRSANADSSGLGLVIIKSIYPAQGPEVKVRSQAGGGSAFHVRLPVVKTEPIANHS